MKALVLFTAALLFLMACGRDQPTALKTSGQPAASEYFKKFTVQWNPGTYLTGGRAQYAQSKTLEVSDGADGKAKFNLFLFDDKESSYVLEYWEVVEGKLQGTVVQGNWFVKENGKLVLLQGSKDKVAEGTPLSLKDGKGGISLQFDGKFVLKKPNPSLVTTSTKTPIVLTYAAKATSRILPGEMRKSISKYVSETNASGDETFKD